MGQRSASRAERFAGRSTFYLVSGSTISASAVRDGVWAAGLRELSGAIVACVALRAVRGRFGVSSDEGMSSLLAIGIVLVTVIVAIAMPAVRAAQTRSSELLKDV